jgi:hypothetical protein
VWTCMFTEKSELFINIKLWYFIGRLHRFWQDRDTNHWEACRCWHKASQKHGLAWILWLCCCSRGSTTLTFLSSFFCLIFPFVSNYFLFLSFSFWDFMDSCILISFR